MSVNIKEFVSIYYAFFWSNKGVRFDQVEPDLVFPYIFLLNKIGQHDYLTLMWIDVDNTEMNDHGVLK